MEMRTLFSVIFYLCLSFLAGFLVGAGFNFFIAIEETRNVLREDTNERLGKKIRSHLPGKELFARNKNGEIVYFGEPIGHPELRAQ